MFLSHILEAFLQSVGKSLTAVGLGSALEHAKDALDETLNPVKRVEKTLKEFWDNHKEDWIPDEEGLEKVVERVKQLYEDVKTEGETVFQNIADDVNSALSSGQIPDEGDAGLGKTHDNFTPQGDQFSVGQTPGIDIGGVGLNRTGDGDGGNGQVGYGGDSGSGAAGSSPTPLGVSGGGTTTSGGGSSSSSVPPPTPSDLGLDPNSGAYVEYQPNQGQVQITYPDGTTETRPWPTR